MGSWSILIGAPGAVLNSYDDYTDFQFYDPLYDYGSATIILSGLSGRAIPAENDIVKIVWDLGLASEQVHWQGYLSQIQAKQQGTVYVLRAFTLDAKLHFAQANEVREFFALAPSAITPFGVIQGGGTPFNLLTDASGAAIMVYGNSASVPNRIHAGAVGYFDPYLGDTQFVSDSTGLLRNIKRMCRQSSYDSTGSPFGAGLKGLDWTTTLEGANGSDPRFYLLRRRERAAAYTPETFNIPEDLVNARRGNDMASGVGQTFVVGGGNGNTRVTSGSFGGAVPQHTIEDKAVFFSSNADMLAKITLDIYSKFIEVVAGECYRHNSPTRAGDTVTITQTGVANTNLRVMMRHYSLKTKKFTYFIGRPEKIGRDHRVELTAQTRANNTTPQFTDPNQPQQFATSQFYGLERPTNIVVGVGANVMILDSNIAAHIIGGSSFTNLGDAELLHVRVNLQVTALTRITGVTYDKTTSITIGQSDSGNAGADPHGHTATPNHTATGTNVPLLAGPFRVVVILYFDSGDTETVCIHVFPHLAAIASDFRVNAIWPWAVDDDVAPAGDYTPTRMTVEVFNYGDTALTLTAIDTWADVNRRTRHDHNQLE